jgi:predicted dehydrogenase
MTTTPSTTPVLRLALVGLGPQGQEHLQAAALTQRVRFVAGVDRSAATRAGVADAYPALAEGLFDSLEALRVARAGGLAIDALVLALPHHVYPHEWAAILAFGVPLLKEKPLARNQTEARRFLEQAQQAGCPVLTAIQRRHHPSYVHLHQQLRARGEPVLEAHAHMHLGFGLAAAGVPTDAEPTWRQDAVLSGGGALLDSGYHMVDLLHFVVGPFELVSATMLHQGRPMDGEALEDRVWLTGRSDGTWVQLDSWLHGEAEPGAVPGRFRKSEGLLLRTPRHAWQADRTGVWCDGECLFRTERQWARAMAEQLDAFAERIAHGQWHDTTLWDQLPAMRVIDQAYQQARAF